MTQSPEPGSHSVAPHVRALSSPQPVPVFNCVVHVSRTPAGEVVAKVANLPDIQITAATEREALQKVVAAFKERAAKCVAAGEALPLIDPPPPVAGETPRLIAVHL